MLPNHAALAAILIGACVCLTPALSAAPAMPPAPASRPSILTYETVKVDEGIVAFITPEERSGFQPGNSIAIVGEDGVLVFDTGNLPGVTRRQIAEIRRLTDKPVRYVVNSHWHPDHNLGNAMYRAAFPGVRIIGTAATRDGIRDRAAGYLKDMAGFAATDSLMKVRLATGKLRDGSAMNDTLRANWSVVTRDYDEFLPEVQTAQPLACDQVFADSLTLRLGRRIVKVVTCGLGNTAGDAFVYVPDSHVLLTGDLLTLPCPFPGTSYFSGWIAALERLRAYGARAIVPGHGAVLHDADFLDLTHELLVWTRDQAMAAVREGRSLEDARKSVDFSAWQKRFAGGDLVRWNAFENFYPGPALERAYAEAKYLSEGPLPGR